MNIKVIIFKSVLVLLTVICIFWSGNNFVNDTPLNESLDANTNMVMAYHYYKTGTISQERKISDNPPPTNYREPGYPFYLSLLLNDDVVRDISLKDIHNNTRLLHHLRKSEIHLAAITGILGFILIYMISRSFWFSYLGLFLLGFNLEILNNINTLMTEQISIPLMLLFSIFFYKAIQKETEIKYRYIFMGLAGLAMSLVVLCKAIFLYMMVFVLALMWLTLKSINKKHLAISLAIFLICFSIPTGGWMVRNKSLFGTFQITCRGGNVMATRYEYNKMNATEYFGSFLYWTPDPAAYELMYKMYGKDCISHSNGKLAKLNRGNPEGYYKLGRTHRSWDPADENSGQMKWMLEFLKHPIKHLLVSIPIGWRGILFGRGVALTRPFGIVCQSAVLVSVIYFLGLSVFFFYSIFKRKWHLLAVSLPAIYLLFMNGFFTHNISRYGLPAVGTEIVCTLLVTWYILNRKKIKKQN